MLTVIVRLTFRLEYMGWVWYMWLNSLNLLREYGDLNRSKCILILILKAFVTEMLGDKHDDDDILFELSNGEINNLRTFYKNLHENEFVYVHLYLKNHLRWNTVMTQLKADGINEISNRCKMRFYRPKNGAAEWKTLVGITGHKEYTMFLMTLEDSLNELRESLEKSKIIKWQQLPLFVAVHERFRKMVYEIFEKKNVRWMDRVKALSYECTVPNDVERRELNVNNYFMMNQAWPYKYPGSECFIKSLIMLNGGLRIYKNGQLISWILQVECFGIGLLQTWEEHQGKGYVRLLTRAMTKRISEKYDEDIILFASHEKPKTDLYIRYDYLHVSYTHWLYLEKVLS